MEAVTHWDDLAVSGHELGPMGARRRTADGVKLGMSRIEVTAGKQSTPAHEHTAEEELFYVLGGAGLWWQDGTPGERPPTVMRAADVPSNVEDRPGWEQVQRRIGQHLGAVTTGMSLLEIGPGARSFPFHCHAAEEELFVVLEGEGTLRLGDERHPLRRGSIVSRPAGTRIAHQFVAGDGGMTVLAYSDIDSNDIAFYPDSSKVKLRGLNVVMRVEPVDYWDGED
jgi:uncharacterized cupin superfamily protein